MQRKGKLAKLALYIILGALIGGFMVFVQNNNKVETGENNSYQPKFRHDANLSFIANGDTLSTIEIEIVKEPDEIVQGMMYRREMNRNRGMLFIFPDIRKRFFWMKNTHISLDIIFIDENYQIINIATDTEPYSEEQIPSIYPTKFVVEVNSGYCANFDVAIGDKIDIFF